MILPQFMLRRTPCQCTQALKCMGFVFLQVPSCLVEFKDAVRTGLMGSGDWFRCYAAVAKGAGHFLRDCFGEKTGEDLVARPVQPASVAT